MKKEDTTIEGMAYPVGDSGIRWRCRINGVWYDCDQSGHVIGGMG